MVAVVVALVLEALWQVVRAAADEHAPIASLSFGMHVATAAIVGVALVELARRLTGARRAGAWIAACAYFTIAVAVVVYEAIVYGDTPDPFTISLIRWMNAHGWSVLAAIAVAGLGIAAGRRGAWLAPPAAALAIVESDYHARWTAMSVVGLAAARVALLALLVREAEHRAAPREVRGDAAPAAMRRLEVVAWISAALSMLAFSPSLDLSPYVVLPWACLSVVLVAVVGVSTWSLASLAPRWAWYATTTCAWWAEARLVRSWCLTVHRWWGRLDQIPLREVSWWTTLPSWLAGMSALLALAWLARRGRSRELVVVVAIAALLSVGLLAARMAFRDEGIAIAAVSLAASVAAARAYRVARTMLDSVPRARIVSPPAALPRDGVG